MEGGEGSKFCVMSTEFQFFMMENVLEMDGGDDHTAMRMFLMPVNCTL